MQALKPHRRTPTTALPHDHIQVFFALGLTQCIDLLPRLLSSVVETLRFLGPKSCALSIVGRNSDDGTPEVLDAITPKIEALGTEYFLAYQRAVLGAEMTCAMDWAAPAGASPTFYDAWNLFWNDPESELKFKEHLPFQVFSCWNGAVALTVEPFILKEVAFRSSNPGECIQDLPELLCKDIWFKGYGKADVIPSVNLEYTDDRGRTIKALKGYTSQWFSPEYDGRTKINWKPDPPEQAKCLDLVESTAWQPLNETLV